MEPGARPATLTLGVLGPLTVATTGRPVTLRGQLRHLLAWLSLYLRDGVRTDQLADLLWGEHNPQRPAHQLQIMVGRLSRALEQPVVQISGGRAQLLIDPAEVDANRFAALMATHSSDREAVLVHALDLWRGRPYPDLGDHVDALGEVTRLEQLHLGALDELYALRLAGSAPVVDVVADLKMLTAVHPDHRRLWQLLALGLAKSGRRVEALRVMNDLRPAGRHDPWMLATESAIQADNGAALDEQLARLRRTPR